MIRFFLAFPLLVLCCSCNPEDIANPDVEEEEQQGNSQPEVELIESREFRISVPATTVVQGWANGDWLDLEIENEKGIVWLEFSAPGNEHRVIVDEDDDKIPNLFFPQAGEYEIRIEARDDSTIHTTTVTVHVHSDDSFELGGYVLDNGIPTNYSADLKWTKHTGESIAQALPDTDGFFRFPNMLGNTKDFLIEINAN